MFFSKFTLQYFRSYLEQQTLQFAIPQSSKEGSGITYIVGENNAGKTSLIEALILNKHSTIKTSEKQESGKIEFNYFGEEGECVKKLQLIREHSYRFEEIIHSNARQAFEVIPSRRHREPSAGGNRSKESLLQQSPSLHQRSGGSNMPMGEILKEIEQNTTSYDNFILLAKKVLPNFCSYAIANEESEYVEYITSDGKRHRSSFLGDGVISLLRILAHLHEGSTRPLIIDEPELSLHPLAQKRLVKVISEYAKKRQIIISTHSPYFINREYIKNGATVNRIRKKEDKKSEIYTLSDYSKYEKLVKGANRKQPFLMDIVAKEIFFQDHILFLEGQEDVGLLKMHGDISDEINIFGYGVRGKDNFKLALQLASDLGIEKAAVILDNGKEEEAIKNDLSSDFPNYKILQRDREDIRDKKEEVIKAKIGYFETDTGQKKNDLGDYEHKISQINDYFKN